ncbi:NAD(P)/FAD-dependent oxidoreductase [Paucibacter sp. KCTC 42545]|uniref:NAD(P)/FAD-dependent oxidoreductase n=1 Tax=Paucibacter sp. KCTC 42545 TaxID=1768242 RepID=UPI000733BDF9|nr:FAD-dependent oxidoreductase [Paucibacter sp. KCTC 42545]ALT77982.1 hypothetical protein AT984_13130 [Paucibacter sp. KCTC 42545]
MRTNSAPRIAIIGAGMAGASCAQLLASAGWAVQVFDKSRGVGGRMSTRRLDWTDASGSAHPASFDHGAPCFSAHSADFASFVAQAAGDGLLTRWSPRMAPSSYLPLGSPDLWTPTPDMPALCRSLLAGLPVRTGCAIEALRRDESGWRLESGGTTVDQGFAAVVVAIPPAQAAALLQDHQAAWAQQAQAQKMLPGWALMAVTDEIASAEAPAWDLAWPSSGPLAWVIRDDAKPGRKPQPGLTHWVAHATVDWSQTHLEAPAAEVEAALKQALAQQLGRQPHWHYSTVHRWRYASVPRAAASSISTTTHRWDAAIGLGACGDALGGAGVEGAWASARALAAAINASSKTPLSHDRPAHA